MERGKTYQEVLAERSQDLENGFETSASLGLCVKQFENGQRIEDLENMVCNDPPLRLPPLQCPQQSGSYNCSRADLSRLPSLGSHNDVIFSFEEKESKVSARSKLIVEIFVLIRTVANFNLLKIHHFFDCFFPFPNVQEVRTSPSSGGRR